MSDPVSNADIEDVLSSIRRLVSEEPNGQGARSTPAPEPEVDRFVLTPAFRVVDADRDDTENRESADVLQLGDERVAAEEEVEEDAAESGLEQQEWVEPAVETAAEREEQAPPAELEPQISAAFESDSDWSETGAQAAEQTYEPEVDAPEGDEPDDASPADLTLEQRIAELEAAIEMAPQDWEPDGSEDGSSDETRPLSFDTGDSGEELAEAIAPHGETDANDDGDDDCGSDGSDEEVAIDDVAEAMAHAENALSEQDDTPAKQSEEAAQSEDPVQDLTEPDDQPQDVAEEWQDVDPDEAVALEFPETGEPDIQEKAAEALRGWDASPMQDARAEIAQEESAHPDPVDESAAASDSSNGEERRENFLADDETMIDEEALREIVGDLVRQELQGVLGERITRNVRRLVRREIQRAMAMRDLE